MTWITYSLQQVFLIVFSLWGRFLSNEDGSVLFVEMTTKAMYLSLGVRAN
jgi:hypothetical protein